ncbi:hypothetical protein BJ165DRAFT_653749 [Panaeolus papilionaceus]|nr:hypothetical protein BJ165DRAFT_653749 [Panaeolus papilionaceus]
MVSPNYNYSVLLTFFLCILVQKRRRISKAATSPSSSMATKILGPATNRGSSQSSTCGSCYRYIGMNISNATQCARCLSTSCTICSRTYYYFSII